VVAAGFDYSLHLNPRQGMSRTTLRENIVYHREQREGSAEEERGRALRETEGGDIIVVGRNTFKEVVRGINEGYLGPLETTLLETPPVDPENTDAKPVQLTLPPVPTSQYMSLDDPASPIPNYTFTYVSSLHILGFRHTPLRIYRFLTRRYVAEEIGKQVAACILSQQEREWCGEDSHKGESEEHYWPKTVGKDSELRDTVVVDPRIQSRLLWRIAQPTEEVPDYREATAPDDSVVNVEELVPTEEELNRQQILSQTQSASFFRPAVKMFPGQNRR
jgi:import inner membrane translocase subunit TIM54